MMKELSLAFKLDNAAKQGKPLVWIIRPDGSTDLVFPREVRGNIVLYRDPETKKLEMVYLNPNSLLSMGKVRIIVHIQGYLETLQVKELAFFTLADDGLVHYIRGKLLTAVEKGREAGKLSPLDVEELNRLLSNTDAFQLLKAWNILKEKKVIDGEIPLPDPPARLYAPPHLRIIMHAMREVLETEAMNIIKGVTGMQGFMKPRENLLKLIIMIMAAILLIFIFMSLLGGLTGGAHPATATVPAGGKI